MLTKADLLAADVAADRLLAARRWCEARGGRSTLLISAVRGDGLPELRHLLRELRGAA